MNYRRLFLLLVPLVALTISSVAGAKGSGDQPDVKPSLQVGPSFLVYVDTEDEYGEALFNFRFLGGAHLGPILLRGGVTLGAGGGDYLIRTVSGSVQVGPAFAGPMGHFYVCGLVGGMGKTESSTTFRSFFGGFEVGGLIGDKPLGRLGPFFGMEFHREEFVDAGIWLNTTCLLCDPWLALHIYLGFQIGL
jgi:hypothetical protein